MRGVYGQRVGATILELVTPVAMRGEYGSPYVGISLFHTVGDRDRAVDQINTEFHQIAAELYQAMGIDTAELAFPSSPTPESLAAWRTRVDAIEAKMRASKIWPIWHNVFNPTYEEWNHFYRDQSSWNEFFTSWESYEQWQDRLATLRKAIEKELGHRFIAPPPGGLPKTIWGSAYDEAKHAAEDVWKVAKYAVYGGLALTAVIVLAKLGSDLRSNRDPATTYLQAYRSRKMFPTPLPR